MLGGNTEKEVGREGEEEIGREGKGGWGRKELEAGRGRNKSMTIAKLNERGLKKNVDERFAKRQWHSPTW